MHVEGGFDIMHDVEGVGCVIFRLESGVYIEVEKVLLVPEMRKNFLLVSALEVDKYVVLRYNRNVIIYLIGESLDSP